MIGKKIVVVIVAAQFPLYACDQTKSIYSVSKTIVTDNQILYAQQISETEIMQAGRIKTQTTEAYFAFTQIIAPNEPKTVIIKKPKGIFTWLERSYEYQQKLIAEQKQSLSP